MSLQTSPSKTSASSTIQVSIDDRDESESWVTFIMRHPSLQFWCFVAVSQLVPLAYYIRAGLNQDHFQYLPFLYLSVGYLFFQRWDRSICLPRRRISQVFLAIGLAILVVASIIGSTWLVGLSFAFSAVAFLSSTRETNGLPMTYLGVVLLLSVRLPMDRTAAIVTRLQLVVTQFSANVLDGIGVPNFTKGTLIQLPSKDLLVAEACSGIQSLFTILFLSLLLIAFYRRSALHGFILVALSVLIAIFGNTGRILAIAMAEYWFGFDLSVGWLHSAIGYVALAFAAGLLIACDDLLACGLPRAKRINLAAWRARWSTNSTTIVGPMQKQQDTVQKRWLGFIPIVYAVCGIAMLGHLAMRSTRPRALIDDQGVFIDQPSIRGIVSTIATGPVSHSEVRNGTASEDDRLGKNADIYQCRLVGVPGQLVVSQPYVGWHELTFCYRAIGWQMVQRSSYAPTNGDAPIIYALFTNESGQHGLLAFTGFNADGTIPKQYGGLSRIARWFSPFVPTIWDDPTETEGEPQTAMVQYWTVTAQPIGADGVQAICERVVNARRQMLASLNLLEAT